MSRASGRKNLPREPVLPDDPPDDAQGREIGESARQNPAGSPIAGLTGNIVNYPTVRQQPATGESFDEYRGIMAHGVPNDSETTNQRGLQEATGTIARQRQPPTPPQFAAERPAPAPVPVYITTPAAGGRLLGTSATAKVNVPASGSDPVRIAARDFGRTDMLILVETAAGASGAAPTGIRVDKSIAELNAGFGALVRAGAVSYLKLGNQQDEMFAVSNDGSPCTLSVIYLYGQNAAG